MPLSAEPGMFYDCNPALYGAACVNRNGTDKTYRGAVTIARNRVRAVCRARARPRDDAPQAGENQGDQQGALTSITALEKCSWTRSGHRLWGSTGRWRILRILLGRI